MGGGVALALLSGLLLVLCFPRFDVHLLAWVALVPLFLALRGKDPLRAFALSFLAGFVFFRGVFSWINPDVGVRWTEHFLLNSYLGFYLGLFGLTLSFVTRQTGLPLIVTAPTIWVSVEYLRSHASFLGLPWGLLGHSQYLNLPLIQISSFTGAYGLSFLIVMANATITQLILAWGEAKTPRSPVQILNACRWPVGATSLALLVSLLYGFQAISRQPTGKSVAITVIQGNIPQGERWKPEFRERNLATHVRLTRDATKSRGASVVVWPETSVPGLLLQDLELLTQLGGLARETGTHLVIGSAVRPKIGPREFRATHSFNSAFLVTPQGRVAGQYNKIRLLPFGEYLPHKELLPWPSRLVKAASFVPGQEYTVFNANGIAFGVPICWETIFPDHIRRLVLNGALVMVNITNEAWFGDTPAPYQFMAMNVFRAVENRIPIARAANTGISGFIDAYGRIIGKVTNEKKDTFVSGFLTKDLPLVRARTFYTLYGDVFAGAALIFCAALLAASFVKAARRRVGEALRD